ncbi:MAG TPA: pentapeptide repeat-containing protein [Ktedonobacteraceae bacterium]|nr:pentapeptide repeat-containing protein [Ktedonobacteraceae bacterium]
MMEKLRSKWLHTRRPLELVVIFLSTMSLLALPVVIVIGYFLHWSWTGLSQKTLWDWLQLLIIPAVLALGGSLFNFTTSRTERDIAVDNQQEALLQAYIDKMSELLLEKKLRESKEKDEVRKIARVRTLTVLSRLDNDRKTNILQFLHEAGLIDRDSRIVELSGVDLSGINLSEANLSEANLSEANLKGANLHNANLSRADLSGADLSGAELYNAKLHDAVLSRAVLNEVKMSGAFLLRANLSNVRLEGADLSGADLTGADLTGGLLREVDLSGAGLDMTNLSKANLRDAILSNASLLDAILSETYLSGAKVTQKQLDEAKTIYNIIMPDRSRYSKL